MAKKLPKTNVPFDSRRNISRWLSSSQIEAAFLADDLMYSFGFIDQYLPGLDPILAQRAELGELSWFGGPAIEPLSEWPRTDQGEPLAHIATIFLPEVQAMIESDDLSEEDWPEPGARLPESGYLEVFHHLETYGNPEDDGTQGWLVRHVPWAVDADSFPALVSPPDDLDTPSEVCQAVWVHGGFSVPRAVDFTDDSDERFEAAERVESELYATWMFNRTLGKKVKEPLIPFSHLYGHSDSGTEYALDILQEVRPLRRDGDRHILLLSVESWTFFDGWFGDAGNFEVWIRESDLRDGSFDQSWCMIRTD
ncbi:DUF1963 domain-containing protein [Citricoccus sp. NR2]|uniref:DUF1963 domain-containing protein n=1 Tax=Citricoccus sp. NR2 TaxID=3004095 RepID=UPI0022DD8836|nr:DUF1963 domain-containing protein [Citricoccus sp. NR2]WBL18790.1 DUF1963 domain-containing protein [Citricoccus sp. NR2]